MPEIRCQKLFNTDTKAELADFVPTHEEFLHPHPTDVVCEW